MRRSSSEPVFGTYNLSTPVADTSKWVFYESEHPVATKSSPPRQLNRRVEGEVGAPPPYVSEPPTPRFEWEITQEQKELWLKTFKKLAGKKSTTSRNVSFCRSYYF
jgi:hypothetical protein